MAAERVLIIDDDIDMLKLVGLTLQRVGMQITAANSMKSGLAKIPECNPDLIITDGLMPDGDGCELARIVRLHPEWNLIPIALHDTRTMDQISAAQAGVDDFISKPILPGDLVLRVRRLLARPLTWRTTRRSQRVMALVSEPKDQVPKRNQYSGVLNLSDELLKEYDYPFWLLAEQLHPFGLILAVQVVTSLRDMYMYDSKSSGLRALETLQEKQNASYQLDLPVQRFDPACLVVVDVETLRIIRTENRLADLPIVYTSREPLSEAQTAEIYDLGARQICVLSDNTLFTTIHALVK